MKKYIFIILLFIFSKGLIAQVNIDSLFYSAIDHAKEMEYTKALNEAKSILQIDPARADVMVFIANVYAWSGNYENGLNYINKAYSLNPKNNELYDSWLNILLWSGKYEELIETAKIAEQNEYPDNYNITLKKSLAYKALGDYSMGIKIIEQNQEFADSVQLKTLYNQLYNLNRANQLSAYYRLDFFDNNNPNAQHLAYIDYGFKINKHTLILRVNYANRFDLDDYQIEADYYHVFNNGHYIYSNYGYSLTRNLFPHHRAGLEYYFPFAESFEASFGGRFLNSNTTNVFIATGHIGKYFSNSWLSFRPFYVMQENANAISLILNYRLYNNSPIDYWGIELAYGNSPDDRYILSQSSEIFRLNSYRIKLEKNFSLLKSSELNIAAGYAYEEFNTDLFRNRYIVEILYKYRF